MKQNSTILLLILFLSVPIVIKAQITVRPYNQWQPTQFVSVDKHQPEDYVLADNNWEILYNLRTPHTKEELAELGVKCSDSQMLLLEVGGLINKKKGKWQNTIPILDAEQTKSLRSFSKQVAESIYAKTKTDFISLRQTIYDNGFQDNTLSLVFSYLLDGRMWTKLVQFEDINNNATWSGCYWILYEPRTDVACGTNSFGDQNLILTYVNNKIAPANKIMDDCADEIMKFGRITDKDLISKIKPYDMVDNNGKILFPIIRKKQDGFHQINDKLVELISTELKDNCGALTTQYNIKDEKVAMVMLYHEVMWYLVDNLIKDKIISVPCIFKDEKANKNRLNEVLFFVEGGLMQ